MASNMGASVNGRLRKYAKDTGDDMVSVQVRYALERFLWRLTKSSWGDRIALKGSLIFVAHFGDVYRPTSDIDVNGYGDGCADDLVSMTKEAAAIPCDDGVEFLTDTIEIKKDRDYGTIHGGKVVLDARIDTSIVRIRIDAGFGNVITPDAVVGAYPSLLSGFPDFQVKIYPLETMIAEKVDAMVRHGAETTRLRDYYDLWALSERKSFDGDVLAHAMRQTMAQSGRDVPRELDALSDDFVEGSGHQWEKFRLARGLRFRPPALDEVVSQLRLFLGPVLAAAGDADEVPGVWSPQAGWCPREPMPTAAPF
jgi:predicted nucleotidyltransferase component of viral defense system